MRSRTSHVPRRVASGSTGPAKARRRPTAPVRRERVRGEHHTPNLAPEPQGSSTHCLDRRGSRRPKNNPPSSSEPAADPPPVTSRRRKAPSGRASSRSGTQARPRASRSACLRPMRSARWDSFSLQDPHHESGHPQHRHHRPRRPRQDHPRRQTAQGRRRLPRQSAGGGAGHGLDGPREGKGHHDQGQEHVRPLEETEQDDQHIVDTPATPTSAARSSGALPDGRTGSSSSSTSPMTAPRPRPGSSCARPWPTA